jgi:hypothetical protein
LHPVAAWLFQLRILERPRHIGRDRGSPVSHYESPFTFTGTLNKVTVTMEDDQVLDGDGIGRAQLARE